MRRALAVLGGSALLLTTFGCFDLEHSLTLNKDLSGQASFRVDVSLQPMMLEMLQMSRHMAGKTGEPTTAEVEAARKDFVSQKAQNRDLPEPAKIKAGLREGLPKGVELLDLTLRDEEMKSGVTLLFGFDHVDKLAQIRLKPPRNGPDEAQGEDDEDDLENPAEAPFGDLEVKDEGATFLLTTQPANPAGPVFEDDMSRAAEDPELRKLYESAFQTLHLTYRITATFEVVETNATRRDGSTLIWEYDYETLKRMKGSANPIRVRYKK